MSGPQSSATNDDGNDSNDNVYSEPAKRLKVMSGPRSSTTNDEVDIQSNNIKVF
jgi:hypothetical protein